MNRKSQVISQKTVLLPGNSTFDGPFEKQLAEAHILCVRNEFDKAKLVLLEVLRQEPHNQDARYMLGRIESTFRSEKVDEDDRRAWRYKLNLNNTSGRFWWCAAALFCLAFGGYNGNLAISNARLLGFAGDVTSKLSRGKAGGTFDWIRPVYVDMLYSIAIFLTGILMAAVFAKYARGAAAWEELDQRFQR